MLLPDVNVLLNAFRAGSPFHEACHEELTLLAEGHEPFILIDHVKVGFLRISTLQKLYRTPVSMEASLKLIELLETSSGRKEWHPPERNAFLKMVRESNAQGNFVSDVYLAAVAIEHGAELLTLDEGFRRIRGLRWRKPKRRE